MNFFDEKDVGNHPLKLCPKVVKHPVYMIIMVWSRRASELKFSGKKP
jgi:hypothetical protein